MLEKAVRETKAYYCLECGICTGSCPVSRYNPRYSPRIMVERALLDDDEAMLSEREVWDCLTCGTCSSRCPSTVDYNGFTRAMRIEARSAGNEGVDTHAGVLRALMQLESTRTGSRNTSWIAEDLRASSRGKVMLFTGCLPYYSVIFDDLGVDTIGMANSAIRLMNAAGVRPVVSREERCCGHDLYWTGDAESFRTLARLNLKAIRESGAKTVVFLCPECYAMFRLVYPHHVRGVDFDMLHISEFLAALADDGALSFTEAAARVTYQDPCRLGRFLGVYDAPRALLGKVPGLEMEEMSRNRAEALCCGSSGWVGCTRINKSVQLERLREALETGAETMVTGCPKCSIHLACAAKDGEVGGEVKMSFITDVLAGALAPEHSGGG